MESMRPLTWDQYVSLCRKREQEGRRWISFEPADRQHRRPTSELRQQWLSQSHDDARRHSPQASGHSVPPIPDRSPPRSRTPPRGRPASPTRRILFTESRRRLIPLNSTADSFSTWEDTSEAEHNAHPGADAEERTASTEEARWPPEEDDTWGQWLPQLEETTSSHREGQLEMQEDASDDDWGPWTSSGQAPVKEEDNISTGGIENDWGNLFEPDEEEWV